MNLFFNAIYQQKQTTHTHTHTQTSIQNRNDLRNGRLQLKRKKELNIKRINTSAFIIVIQNRLSAISQSIYEQLTTNDAIIL